MDRRKILLVVAVLVAALGAGLVFVYAQGAEDRAAEKFETRPVLVATQTILPGESASDAAAANKLVSRDVPAQQILDGATNNGRDFTGEVALTTIYPGEQLIDAKFGSADEVEGAARVVYPEGDIVVQVPLTDYAKVGAFTQPGSHVVIFVQPAVVAALEDPETGETQEQVFDFPRAEVLLSDVLVVGVGSSTTTTTADGTQLEETPTTNLSIAVNENEARLVLAAAYQADQEGATLWFGLRNEQSDIKPSEIFNDGKIDNKKNDE